MDLTEQQRAVVESKSQRIVVLSCAGSGKTTVIALRIAKLWENGVAPDRILSLTFSNKASQEMKRRICKEDKALGFKTNVRTFHAFGLDLIRKSGSAMGFYDQIRIARRSQIQNILHEIAVKRGNALLEGDHVISYIKKCKNFELMPHEKELDAVFSEYCAALKSRCLIDMEDMIWLTVNYLKEHQEVRDQISKQYRYIFVDEYQDTNEAQNKLLGLLINETTNVCLVGDDDQAIYEWRGAKPRYIRQFARSERYELLKMERNFRSQAGIIDIANTLISHNQERIPKAICAERNFTFKPVYARFSNQTAEAEFVAGRISELVAEGKYSPSDIAVLYRVNEQAALLQSMLNGFGIEYDTLELDENAQYSQFVDVLQSIASLTSTTDLSNALNFPERCLDRFLFNDAKAAYCDAYGQDCNYSTLEWLDKLYLSDVQFENCAEFRERYGLITQLHQVSTTWSPSQIIATYLAFMERKRYNVRFPDKYHFVLQTYDIAKSYEEAYQERSLTEFLYQLDLSITAQDTSRSVNLEAVNLLTMHRSKGLEFKVVFIVGVQCGIIPNEYFIQSENDLEADRRLLYVAITRAKDLLFMTSFKDPFGSNGSSQFVKHGFLAEIPKVSFADVDFVDQMLRKLPDKSLVEENGAQFEKATIDCLAETIADTTREVKAELVEIQDEKEFTSLVHDEVPSIGDAKECCEDNAAELPSEALEARGLKDLTEDQVDSYMELSIALSHEIAIPENKYVVIVGATDIKTKVVKSLLKTNSIPNYELYDYEGKGFNLNKYFNNFRCVGIILGPEAHKIDGVDARSLKGKLLSTPGYPYMVDLIERHITKTSLQEAIAKIKWSFVRNVN